MPDSNIDVRNTEFQEDLRQYRIDLAAAFRIVEMYGWVDGIGNHFSFAVTDELFLINPFGLHWSEITASKLPLVDLDGKIVDGGGYVEASAFFIHSRIHRACPQARCLLHTHQPYATALTLLGEEGFEPCEQSALGLHGRIVWDEHYNGLVHDAEEGDRLAALLGDKAIMLMANHGVMTAATTVAQAFADLYMLEQAAKFQILARSTGLPIRKLPQDVIDATAKQFVGERESGYTEQHLTALKRVLDRDAPDYKD